MMTLPQVETAIYTKIGQFTYPDTTVRIENQPLFNGQQFVPPTDKPWCKVFVQYADGRIVGIGNGPCKRNFGIISIQCFTPKDKGTLDMANLCEAWTQHIENFQSSQLEVYLVHPPQDLKDDNFYGKIIRAEFSVN